MKEKIDKFWFRFIEIHYDEVFYNYKTSLNNSENGSKSYLTEKVAENLILVISL